MDHQDPAVVVATVASTSTQTPTAIRVPGLVRDRRYLVRSVAPSGDRHVLDLGTSWLEGPGVVLPGSALADVGVRLPVTAPESAYVLHVGESPREDARA